jgi:hypothetical protein
MQLIAQEDSGAFIWQEIFKSLINECLKFILLDRLLVSLLLPDMHEIRYGHEVQVGKELVKAYLKVFFQHLHA